MSNANVLRVSTANEEGFCGSITNRLSNVIVLIRCSPPLASHLSSHSFISHYVCGAADRGQRVQVGGGNQLGAVRQICARGVRGGHRPDPGEDQFRLQLRARLLLLGPLWHSSARGGGVVFSRRFVVVVFWFFSLLILLNRNHVFSFVVGNCFFELGKSLSHTGVIPYSIYVFKNYLRYMLIHPLLIAFSFVTCG